MTLPAAAAGCAAGAAVRAGSRATVAEAGAAIEVYAFDFLAASRIAEATTSDDASTTTDAIAVTFATCGSSPSNSDATKPTPSHAAQSRAPRAARPASRPRSFFRAFMAFLLRESRSSETQADARGADHRVPRRRADFAGEVAAMGVGPVTDDGVDAGVADTDQRHQHGLRRRVEVDGAARAGARGRREVGVEVVGEISVDDVLRGARDRRHRVAAHGDPRGRDDLAGHGLFVLDQPRDRLVLVGGARAGARARRVGRAARLPVDGAHLEVRGAAGVHCGAHRALEGAQHRFDAAVVRRLGERREVAPVAAGAAEGAVDQVPAHEVGAAAVAVHPLGEIGPPAARRARTVLRADRAQPDDARGRAPARRVHRLVLAARGARRRRVDELLAQLFERRVDHADDGPASLARLRLEAAEIVPEPDRAEDRADQREADAASGQAVHGLHALAHARLEPLLRRRVRVAAERAAREVGGLLPDPVDRAVEHLVDARLDVADGGRDLAGGDRGDRVHDRLDEIEDMADALDEELDRGVGLDDRLDHRAHGREERKQLLDARHHQALLAERADRAERRLAQAAEELGDAVAQRLHQAALADVLDQLEGALEHRHRALAHQAHQLLAHARPGEPEDLQHEPDDAAQVPALGHLHAGRGHGAREPRDHAVAQVHEDVAHELADALADGGEQVAQETDRVADDGLEGRARAPEDGDDARAARAHRRLEDQLEQLHQRRAGEADQVDEQRPEDAGDAVDRVDRVQHVLEVQRVPRPRERADDSIPGQV